MTKFLLIACVLLLSGFSARAQNPNNYKTETIKAVYRLPTSRNGLTESHFNITAQIRIERWQDKADIIINLRAEQGTPATLNPGYLFSYNYQGRQYGDGTLGQDVFSGIRATNLTYEVTCMRGGTQKWVQRVDGRDNIFGPVAKDYKASDVNIFVKVVDVTFFNGQGPIEAKIRGLKEQEDAASRPAPSPAAAAPNNLAAGTARPAPRTASNQSGSTAPATQRSGSPVAPGTEPGRGTGNTSNSSSRPSGGSGGITSSSAGRPSGGSGGITNMSGIVVANGEKVQVYQQGEKYFMQRADGSTHETSRAAYDAIQQVDTRNRTQRENFANEQKAALETQNAENERNHNNYLEQQQLAAAKAERDRLNIQLATQAVSVAGDIISEIREKKLANEKRIKEENIARLEEARREFNLRKAKITARKSFLAGKESASIPLSTDDVSANELYYFAYGYEPSTLEESPKVYLSNIFQISRNGDRTWPYTPDIQKELTKANNYHPVILVGHYLSKGEAESEYEAFKRKLATHECATSPFVYAGKIKKQTATPEITNTNLDFWGNPVKN